MFQVVLPFSLILITVKVGVNAETMVSSIFKFSIVSLVKVMFDISETTLPVRFAVQVLPFMDITINKGSTPLSCKPCTVTLLESHSRTSTIPFTKKPPSLRTIFLAMLPTPFINIPYMYLNILKMNTNLQTNCCRKYSYHSNKPFYRARRDDYSESAPCTPGHSRKSKFLIRAYDQN